MTSQQIEYILTVAELRSFSKAAQKLYVTQPSLSQYIMKTEQKLGFQIFDRSSSPIGLTAAGEIFISYAEQFRALEESMNNRLSDIGMLNTGTLRIGASAFRASCLLSKSIAEFSRQYDGIKISVAEGDDASLAEMVRNNKLDIIITAGNPDASVFYTEKLAKERLYLSVPRNAEINNELKDFCLSAEDIKQQSMKLMTTPCINLKKLTGLPFIAADGLDYANDKISRIFKDNDIQPAVSLNVNSIETVFSFVNSGLGAAFIPDTMIRFGNYSEHPCYYAVEPEISEAWIKLCSKKNGYFSNAAKQYCLILKQLIDIGTWRLM